MEVSSGGGGGGGGGIHALCEDALAEILVRLPSESVLRCRAVCRSWRRVAASPRTARSSPPAARVI
ncbi:F-box protein [Panicum miliaceum]|uniref:F-box protein n=1 Tax=Panicum miliaceum TaxID=4540 RepID=A0A3L6RCN9_PANMI|nr:F-box protein [Panicum miliaceum]